MKTHISFLPVSRIVDSTMNLQQTMKLMGRNFKILNKACTFKDRIESARELETWASQAQALGFQGVSRQPINTDQQRQFQQGMLDLRKQIAVLKTALKNDDKINTQAALKKLNNIRKHNHELFIPK